MNSMSYSNYLEYCGIFDEGFSWGYDVLFYNMLELQEKFARDTAV